MSFTPTLTSTTRAKASTEQSVSGFLTPVLLGMIAGVCLQLQQRALFSAPVYGTMVLVGLLSMLVMVLRCRPTLAGVFGAVLLSGLLSFGATGWRAVLFAETALSPLLEGQNILVTGQVTAMPQVGEDGVRFRLAIDSARLNGQAVVLPAQVYLGWYSGFGGRVAKNASFALTESDLETPEASLELQRQPQPLRAGERWQMTVRLKAPHGNSNPHGFDYELWLWEQGVQATGYVRAGVHDIPPQKLASSWAHPIERARQAVREAIFDRVPNRQIAGVLAALVVGDQNAIERADWDIFRATGVAHLMSISGLHITMFAWAASLLLGGLWRRSHALTPSLCLYWPASSAAAWGGLVLATLYALFSGWGLPAQRTIWMLATVVALRQSGRQWPWPVVWLLAMAVVVALDPWALLQAGFWLSFVAVGILFASDSGATHAFKTADTGQNAIFNTLEKASRWRTCWRCLHHLFFRFLLRPLKALRSAAREQWVVTLALTPLSLLLFNQVSVVGLLANAFAIPWVTVVVTPLAMAGVLWPPVWTLAAAAVSMLTVFLQWLASWPFASINLAAAPLWCAVAGVVGGGLWALRLPFHVRVLGIPLLLPVLLWQPVRPEPGQFELLGADVGQGNALLVRTSGHTLVYDTGPRFSRESDAGHRVLVPLLRALGERVDVLMLSHRDSDHTGGAASVMAMQPQAQLISSMEALHPLQQPGKSARCEAGQRWRWDGVDFEVLHPSLQAYDQTGQGSVKRMVKANAMSCVLRISNGQKTALLVGDLEAPQELSLVADTSMRSKLKADFLLVPHHGSKTSSTQQFLEVVKPRIALVQAGYRNRFNHPVPSVLARYFEQGIEVVDSPACGAATWSSASPQAVTCQRNLAQRYWHHQIQAQQGFSK